MKNETGEIIDFSGVEDYEEFKKSFWEQVDNKRKNDIIEPKSAQTGSVFDKNRGYNPADIEKACRKPTANFVTENPKSPEYDYGIAIESVKPIKGVYDIKAHGDYDGVIIFDSPVDAKELARIMMYRKDYSGQPIRLLSCSTGKMVNGTCVAKELSEALGVKVIAPNDDIVTDGKGLLRIGHNRLKDEGEFVEFEP